MAQLSQNSYGKQRVRLTKIVREQAGGDRAPGGAGQPDSGRADAAPVHHVHEYTVEIMLYGAFDRVYTHGENATCVPTDTMRNTVYAVARKTSFTDPEELADAVSRRFTERFPQVHAVDVSVEAERWRRIDVDGKPHPHAFEKEHGKRTAVVSRQGGAGSASRARFSAGIGGMEVFKSTGSAFSGFYKDEYTTLPETEDRILATTVDADWDYDGTVVPGQTDFAGMWQTVHDTVARVFAEHDSPSLQATLWEMGKAVLSAVPAVRRVSFSMPNQHHIRFDLEKLGLDNPNEIFYGTDSPYGIITGTVEREEES